MTQQMLTPEQRRAENRRRHWTARQERQEQRGSKGVATAWWDRARAVAAEQERQGNPQAWDDLARFLENYAARYSQ